jgi:hypothetical protein
MSHRKNDLGIPCPLIICQSSASTGANKGLAALAERKIANGQSAAVDASAKAAVAKERVERIRRGENVEGGARLDWLAEPSLCSVAMSSRPRIRASSNNPRAAASRSWRASLIRKKAQVLGEVEAPSREAAEAAAVREFNLTDEQRSRLVVQERG